MAMLLLSLVPLAAGAARLVCMTSGDDPSAESARFVLMPWPVALRIVGATLFCLLGTFQFDAALRRRSLALHRGAGRLAAAGGMRAALSGVWMTVAYPIPEALQGDLLYTVRVLVGVSLASRSAPRPATAGVNSDVRRRNQPYREFGHA